MAHEEAAVAKQPLFEIAEGMLNDGAAPRASGGVQSVWASRSAFSRLSALYSQ